MKILTLLSTLFLFFALSVFPTKAGHDLELDVNMWAFTGIGVTGEGSIVNVLIKNTGNTTVHAAQVRVKLFSGLTYWGDTSNGNYSPSTALWNAGDIGPGQYNEFQIIYTAYTPGIYQICGEVYATLEDGDTNPLNNDPDSTPNNGYPPASMEDDGACSSLEIKHPFVDMEITQTPLITAGTVNDTYSFTIYASAVNGNLGPDQLMVQVHIPNGLQIQNFTTFGGTFDPVTAIWYFPFLELDVLAYLEIQLTATAPGNYTVCTEVLSTQQDSDTILSNDDPDSNPGNLNNGQTDEDDDDCITLHVGSPRIDLELTKTYGDLDPVPGDAFSYVVKVRNTGVLTAHKIVVEEKLPAGVSYLNHFDFGGDGFDLAAGLWKISALAPGSEATLFINVHLISIKDTKNCAQVLYTKEDFDSLSSNDDPDSIPGNLAAGLGNEDDQACVLEFADLRLLKYALVCAPLYQSFPWRVLLRNYGPDGTNGVKVFDQLSHSLNLGTTNTSAGVYDPGTKIWNVGTIEAGQSHWMRMWTSLVIQGPQSGPIGNQAEVFASHGRDPDSIPANGNPLEDDWAHVFTQVCEMIAGPFGVQVEQLGDTVLAIEFAPPTHNPGESYKLEFSNKVSIAALELTGTFDLESGLWQPVDGIEANRLRLAIYLDEDGTAALARLQAAIFGEGDKTSLEDSHFDPFLVAIEKVARDQVLETQGIIAVPPPADFTDR